MVSIPVAWPVVHLQELTKLSPPAYQRRMVFFCLSMQIHVAKCLQDLRELTKPLPAIAFAHRSLAGHRQQYTHSRLQPIWCCGVLPLSAIKTPPFVQKTPNLRISKDLLGPDRKRVQCTASPIIFGFSVDGVSALVGATGGVYWSRSALPRDTANSCCRWHLE